LLISEITLFTGNNGSPAYRTLSSFKGKKYIESRKMKFRSKQLEKIKPHIAPAVREKNGNEKAHPGVSLERWGRRGFGASL
jgi:hypothetical protein